MRKSELIIELQKFTGTNSVTLDLYFVFKDGDYFNHYRTHPNTELSKEIINGFTTEITRHCAPDSTYELHDVYDDNEYEDFTMFYDSMETNPISKSMFVLDKPSINDYTSDIGELSKIFGFLIELHNGEETLYVFKRNQPTHAVSRNKFINFFYGQDNNLKLINQDTIYITKSIDLMVINNKVIILNKKFYEAYFGFKEKIKQKASDSFLRIIASDGFIFEEEIHEKVR